MWNMSFLLARTFSLKRGEKDDFSEASSKSRSEKLVAVLKSSLNIRRT